MPEPTSAAAARIAALVKQLTPRADAATGELIRAEDWNVVVGALIEVARAVLGTGGEEVAPAHAHPDQVAVGWLDENLRGLLQRGPLSDPAVEARVGGIERQIALLASRIEELTGGLERARQHVSDVATNDLLRANDVATVRRTVDGLGDARLDVAKLRSSLDDLHAGVATAVSVSQRLTVDGQPVDMGAVVDRIKKVEALRDQLSLPTGDVFDPRLLDQRLDILATNGVNKDDLTTALASHTATLSPKQLKDLRQGATDDAVAAVGPSIAAATDAVRADVSAQLSTVDDKVSAAVAETRAATVTAAVAVIRPELAAAVGRATDTLTAAIGDRVGASADTLRSDLGGRIDRVTARLTDSVSAEVGRQIGTRLDSLNATVGSLSSRLDKAEVRAGNSEFSVSQLSAQIAQASRDDAAARQALEASIKSDIDRREEVTAAKLDGRFAEADRTNRTRTDQAVVDSERSILGQVEDVAVRAAITRVDATANELRGEFRATFQRGGTDNPQVIRRVATDERGTQ